MHQLNSNSSIRTSWNITVTSLITVFYLGSLLLNNLAWVTAGEQAHQIEQEFSQVKSYATASGHDLSGEESGLGIVLEGLPDNYQGAYIARNMFSFQDNLGAVFYGLRVPAGQAKVGQNALDFSKVDFKTLYILNFAMVENKIKLQTVQKLDKSQTP